MPIFVYDYARDIVSAVVDEVNAWESVFLRGVGRIALLMVGMFLAYLLLDNLVFNTSATLWVFAILLGIEVIFQVGSA